MCQQFMKLIDIDQVHHRCEHLFTSGTYHSVIGIQQGSLGSEVYSLFYLDISDKNETTNILLLWEIYVKKDCTNAVNSKFTP